MTLNNPSLNQQLRAMFKTFNRGMLALWRLGFGPSLNVWPAVFGRYMVLTTVGRKSGLPRRTPLNYAEIDGAIYCTAGFGGGSDWYRNIKSNPQVEVWLPTGWWAGEAEEVTGGAERLDILRAVLRGSGFVAPLMGLNPYALSDAKLAAATAEYHVVQINRSRERTGRDGPGEYAWIWPWLAQALVLVIVLIRVRRRQGGGR